MTFRIRISPLAQAEIEAFTMDQIARPDETLSRHLGASPHTWVYFALNGAPYRTHLFRVGRKIQYWIICTIDDGTQIVNVLRFWQVSRSPDTLEL